MSAMFSSGNWNIGACDSPMPSSSPMRHSPLGSRPRPTYRPDTPLPTLRGDSRHFATTCQATTAWPLPQYWGPGGLWGPSRRGLDGLDGVSRAPGRETALEGSGVEAEGTKLLRRTGARRLVGSGAVCD